MFAGFNASEELESDDSEADDLMNVRMIYLALAVRLVAQFEINFKIITGLSLITLL